MAEIWNERITPRRAICAGDAPGLGTTTVAEYLGLKLRHVDSTECGGSAPILHVAHAAEAIAAGRPTLVAKNSTIRALSSSAFSWKPYGVSTMATRAGASSKNCLKSSRGTRKGTYTLFMPRCMKAALWISGLRLCPIGSAITP